MLMKVLEELKEKMKESDDGDFEVLFKNKVRNR